MISTSKFKPEFIHYAKDIFFLYSDIALGLKPDLNICFQTK